MNKSYVEVTILKRKRKKIILFCLVGFICLVSSVFLSFVTAPILKLTQIVSTNNYEIKKDYYVLSLNSNITDKDEATKQAQNIKTRGGAGVLDFDETYYIAIACYENEKDANSVYENLKSEEKTYVVKKLTAHISTKNLEEKKDEYIKYFNFATSLISSLFELIKDLDTNNTTSVLANLKIISLKMETSSLLDELLKNNDETFKKMKNIFLEIYSILEYSSQDSTLNTSLLPYSSVLRQAQIHIIKSLCKL